MNGFKRLTTDKPQGMYELAHNSCYIGDDGAARYRDFETDIDVRDLARKLMVSFGQWKSAEEYGLDADNELIDDDIFDDSMLELLSFDDTAISGLIALFYRNLWAMADLRERLKAYEDTGLTPKVCMNYKIFEDECICDGVQFKDVLTLKDILMGMTCETCRNTGKCAIEDNFNIKYCSDWERK